MSDERKKPGIGFWTSVAFVVAVLYVLSIGPVCWVSSRTGTGTSFVSVAYRPLTWGVLRNEPIGRSICWYSQFGSAKDWALGHNRTSQMVSAGNGNCARQQ